jgi:hypothetical protein
MATKKAPPKQFMYGVGFYWEGDSGHVGLYASGSEIFYGTMEEAKNFQAYCQSRPDNKGKDKRQYKIFQLIEVPE